MTSAGKERQNRILIREKQEDYVGDQADAQGARHEHRAALAGCLRYYQRDGKQQSLDERKARRPEMLQDATHQGVSFLRPVAGDQKDGRQEVKTAQGRKRAGLWEYKSAI